MKSALALLSFFSPLALTQSLCGQYSYHGDSAGWYFNNNAWGSGSGSGSQCTYVDGIDGTKGVKWHTDWNWSGGQNNVKSYPYSGRQITPRIVSSIGSIPSVADWAYSGNNIRANVAYDLFTASNPNHATSSGDYELMIWLARIGGVQPIGSSTGVVSVGGRQWELWVGYNGSMKVFSYVATSQLSRFDQDIKPFFNHMASSQGYPASSQYLITFQFGTEPFTGSNAKFSCYYWSGWVA